MSVFVFVKPAEGARVRMPDRNSNVMPAEGAIVPRSVYYERLIMTGEIAIDDVKTAEIGSDRKQETQETEKAALPAPEKAPAEPASHNRRR